MHESHNPNPGGIVNQAFQLLSVAGKVARLMESVREAVQLGDFDTVLANLQQKQRLIDELETLPELRQSYQQCFPELKRAQCDRMQALLEQLDIKIKAITQTEQDVMIEIQSRRQAAAKHLRDLAHHREASRSYRHCEPIRTNRRIDISS